MAAFFNYRLRRRFVRQVRQVNSSHRSSDPIEDTRLRAVEFLVPLAVLIGKLDHEFEVRTMHARESLDRAAASSEYLLQV